MPAQFVAEGSRFPGLRRARRLFAADAAVREPWRSAIVLALFATLLVIVGPRHEAWFDESQAWLLGRHITLWGLLTERLPYEGTPALWHGLLWLLSHAGMPFSWLWMVSGAFACAGAWVILRYAPFPFWLRVGVIFSYFIAYQYAVVARGYALCLLLIPLIAAVFAHRLRRPMLYGLLLGLCANINAYSFIIAAVLFAEFVVAVWRSGAWQRAHAVGGAIYIVMGCIAALQAWPPPDSSFAAGTAFIAGRGHLVISEAFIDRWDVLSALPPTEIATKWGFAISLLLLAPSMLLIRRAGVAPLVAALLFGLIGFSVMKFANAWHGGLIFLVWVFALWIAWGALGEFPRAHRRVIVASVAAIVFVNVFYTARAALREIREPYSAGPAAAQLLARHPPRDAPIAAAGFKAFAVQPWFDTNAFRNYHDGAPDIAYFAWRFSEPFKPAITPQRWHEMVTSPAYGTLLLSNYEISHDDLARYTAAARAAGYCKTAELPGGLIWKSYVREDDALMVFSRCAGGLAQSHTD